LSKAETSFKEKIQAFTHLKNNGMIPNSKLDISRKEIISYDDEFQGMIHSNLKDIGEMNITRISTQIRDVKSR
jgi:hypothetical protein